VADPHVWLQGRYLLPIAAAPVVALTAIAARPSEPERVPVLPLLPLVALLLAYLVVKVPTYFYQ